MIEKEGTQLSDVIVHLIMLMLHLYGSYSMRRRGCIAATVKPLNEKLQELLWLFSLILLYSDLSSFLLQIATSKNQRNC